MRLRRGLLRRYSWLALLAVIAAIPTHSYSQNVGTKLGEREQLIAAAREIMSSARYCALITLDAKGQAQARTMDPFPPGEDLVVWLGTNARSRKVGEIRKHPHVVLYYFDQPSQSYVTLKGIARLVNDSREKTRHWKDEWKDFYPDRESGYLLIAVAPEKLEVVSVKKNITGDPNTWNPPAVIFKKN